MIRISWEWEDGFTTDVRPIEILDINDFWLAVMKNYTIEYAE